MTTKSLLGVLIDERFLIKSELGSGGFGSIYLAHQVDLNRDVAVKILHSDLLDDDDSLVRFEREAKIIAGLNHKNIVRCYAYGVWQKMPFMAFELLRGDTLRKVLQKETELPWEKAFSIGADVCSGLSHAHAEGVIHRDIKPENVFITDEGTVKLIDFGLSHLCDQHLTQTGALIGTAQYMSPEQSLGQKVGPGADLYALACFLYECIAGRPPFSGDNPFGLMYLHRTEDAPPISSTKPKLPAFVDEILSVGMAKEPSDRFKDALEFEEALRRPDRFVGRDHIRLKTKRPSNHSLRAPHMVLLLVVTMLIGGVFLTPNGLIADGLALCAQAVPQAHRSQFYTSCAETLRRAARTEASAVFLSKACKDLSLSKMQRLELLTQSIRSMMALNYTNSILGTFDDTVVLLRSLTIDDLAGQDARNLAWEAVAGLNKFVETSQLGQRNSDYLLARSHVSDLFLEHKEYRRFAACRMLVSNSNDYLTNVKAMLSTVSDLDEVGQLQILEECLREQKKRAMSPRARGVEPVRLYEDLRQATQRKRQGVIAKNIPIIEAAFPWMASANLPPSHMLELLEATCAKAHQRWKFADLSGLYPLLKDKAADDPDSSFYEPYMELLKGQWLMSQGKTLEGLNVCANLLKTSSDEVCEIAGANAASVGDHSPVSGKVDHRLLDAAAAAILARAYPGYKDHLKDIYGTACYDYAEKKQLLQAAASARAVIAYIAPGDNMQEYSYWNSILASTLEHDNKSVEAEKLLDEALAVGARFHATDAQICEVIAWKAYMLAKRKDKKWLELQSRAEAGSKSLDMARREGVARMRTYCLVADPP